jgi:ParB family transcriptional regulator, chromosome partitioning protein
MARKNLLAGLLDPADQTELTAVNSPRDDAAAGRSERGPAPAVPSFTGRGAVGAMSRSLERLTSEVVSARAAEDQLRSGSVAVDLDPGLVDPSPAPDRLPVIDGPGEDAFVAVIRAQGQQTPILVRPHPTVSGRYQVAFGHRRLRAAAALGRPVRALVRTLTDAELVVAQGQENNARADLSFIERAAFALTLERLGHGRDVIMAALLVDKTELSRLIAARRALPDSVIAAIGPAPKAGRRRWMSLADRLASPEMRARVDEIVAADAFATLSSDQRFVRVYAAVAPVPAPAPPVVRAGPEAGLAEDGRRLARIERTPTTVGLIIDETLHPAFGDFLVARLPELFAAYEREQARGPERSGL